MSLCSPLPYGKTFSICEGDHTAQLLPLTSLSVLALPGILVSSCWVKMLQQKQLKREPVYFSSQIKV